MVQVRFNQESTQRQYALQEKALLLGWPEEKIRVIDEDLGISGSGRSKRPGFAQLVTTVSLGGSRSSIRAGDFPPGQVFG